MPPYVYKTDEDGFEVTQDTMIVCINGHIITDEYVRTIKQIPKICTLCGATTIVSCQDCEQLIPGRIHKVIGQGVPATIVPAHCGECGKPFPWTKEKSEKEKSTANLNLSNRIFVVHGHDEGMKSGTARTLERLGLEAVVLNEQVSEGNTIVEKFEKHADVGYAIVLLSPDIKHLRRVQT